MNENKVITLNPLQIKELQQIYKDHIPYATHVNSLLLIYFKWKNSHPDNEYLKFYGLQDDWKKSGTFIMMLKSFDIFMFTLDKSGEDLYSLLKESKCFKTAVETSNKSVIYGIRNEHLPPIYKSLKDLEIPPKATFDNYFYYLPKEEALKFSIECPDDVYIDKLNLSHIDLICSLWPHAFPGVEEYLSIYIKMNGGFGVFLKENGRLVSWILQNHWGTLTVLETVPEFKRRGYGSLIVKKMCVEIAREGINPLCTIITKNKASQSLFLKLGFQYIGDCTFIAIK